MRVLGRYDALMLQETTPAIYTVPLKNAVEWKEKGIETVQKWVSRRSGAFPEINFIESRDTKAIEREARQIDRHRKMPGSLGWHAWRAGPKRFDILFSRMFTEVNQRTPEGTAFRQAIDPSGGIGCFLMLGQRGQRCREIAGNDRVLLDPSGLDAAKPKCRSHDRARQPHAADCRFE